MAYKHNLDKARKNEHLIEILKNMHATYYTAIVTTASRENTTDILKYFECEELFDLLVTQEDVSKVKPDPEGFVRAMEYFEVNSEHTIIFEDSEVGVQAAQASGASVMVIKNFERFIELKDVFGTPRERK